MNIEKQKAFLIRFAYFAVIAALIYVVFRFGLPLVMPFVVAFAVAAMLMPLIRLLTEKTKMKHFAAAIVIVILFYSTVGVLLTFLLIRLFSSLQGIFLHLPIWYTQSIQPYLFDILDKAQKSVLRLDPALVDAVEDFFPKVVQSVGQVISNISVRMMESVSGFAAHVPGYLISVLICIISTFFISVDYGVITQFILRQLPPKARVLLRESKQCLGETLVRYIKSYALIMLITFCELCLGLGVLGVHRFWAVALVIAIFDILPIVGTGGIMIPWVIISLIQSKYGMALGIFAVYLAILVVRNIIEPKIVGNQVGLHPIVALCSMFVGAKLFGFIGLFGLPITLAIAKTLHDNGRITLYKKAE